MSSSRHLAQGLSRTSATVTTLRKKNRASVLKFILRERETTRAEVARQCGVSTASAANIITELIEEGLVQEVGSVASRGGRPISVIAPNRAGAYSIGVDVGERGIAIELFDLAFSVIDREFRGGEREESAERIHQGLEQGISALQERHPGIWDRVLGVGLGLPGIVEGEPGGGQTLIAQSLGWDPLPIPGQLVGLPTYADNGAHTLARAELWYGAARGVEHAVVGLLGRGVGLGVVSGGELYRGAFGGATEWGHTKVRYGGQRCRCGQLGCLEAYVGADALLREWEEAGGQFEGTGWGALGSLLTASESDPVAAAVVDNAIEALGAGLGSIVNLTNPQRVVIGGWVGMRLMDAKREQLESAARRNSMTRLSDQFELVSATFGGDTVALGSALLPVEHVLLGTR